MGIGTRLRILRREKGLTQKDIAADLGISQQAWGHYETGRRTPDADMLLKLAAYFGVSTDYLLDAPSLPSNLAPIESLAPHHVPLIGSVAAGQPIFADQEYGVLVDEPDRADYALRVEGDSMEPIYLHGDIVYIKQVPDVDDGQIAVVLLDDEAAIKRVYHLRSGLLLISENSVYKPIQATYPEYTTIRILSIPVGFMRLQRG